ncbi:hypothetical protein EXU57_18390 [Segetibacter sp. 3557_3]|uniref:hypothetical protein n=1 Tax=Segetibacter sp. 3557_3 TaxID=2547429 RepID=UPI0010585217|nr:hypothetical protein [Segetibacter sp. 3557_3]TDH23029.1 hypothetical protein EXU57_18390 [Segetibacter sp. 3557_3]
MVALFKDRSPANVIWLIILSIVVHSHFVFSPPQVQARDPDGLISVFLLRYLSDASDLFLILVYHTIVVVQALRLNYLFNDQRMFTRNNFITAMVYIMLTGLLPEWSNITPVLIINTLLIWLFVKLVRLYNHPNPKTLLFNTGLIIGLSVLLYHPSVLLVLVVIFALLVVRPFNLPELLVMVMGVLSPFYFFAVYLFLNDEFPLFYRNLPRWSLNLPAVENPRMLLVTAVLLLLMLGVGLFHWQGRTRRMLIHVRKNWGVLLVMLVVTLPLPFISIYEDLDGLMLWLIPASPFIAEGFLGPKKNTFPNAIFWTLLVLIGVNNWGFLIRR